MNKELFQLNDNLGAVTNEKGNLRVVYKGNNNCEFKDILEKENELELLKNENKKLSDELFSIKTSGTLSDLIILIGLISGFATYSYFGDLGIWFSMLSCYVPAKIVSLIVGSSDVGFIGLTRIGRIIAYIKKNKKYKELKNNIDNLSEEVKNMQLKSEYLGDSSHDFTPIINECLHSDVKIIDLNTGKSSNKGKRRVKTRNELTR